ncbi:MAG: hypothetical protein K0S32_1289 [Bacteroidetes bacterium]|jgi:hypothetical protein|nr:hypothetical protein [Bacteroidota bacterium]
MDLNGKWSGTVVYGKGYGGYEGKELYFDFDLIQNGKEIAGTAFDTGGVGMSPDQAQLFGTFENNQFEFLKQYDSLHYYSNEGEVTVDKTQKGPLIKYSGIYNTNTDTFSGFWFMKVRVLILWIIPWTINCGGIWSLRRK